MTHLLDEKQAAGLLKVSVKTLQGWRVRGGGPPFVKLGRCVRYALSDLETFVQDSVRRSTGDAGFGRPTRAGVRTEPLLERTGRRLSPLAAAGSPVSPPPQSSAAYMAPTPNADDGVLGRKASKK